jgi:hypothetical protein
MSVPQPAICVKVTADIMSVSSIIHSSKKNCPNCQQAIAVLPYLSSDGSYATVAIDPEPHPDGTLIIGAFNDKYVWLQEIEDEHDLEEERYRYHFRSCRTVG